MFLALCGLLNVAQETLPKLEYLTNCDELIFLSTLIVFLVNVWNCVLLQMWNAAGTPLSDSDDAISFADVSCSTVETISARRWATFWRLIIRLLGTEPRPTDRQVIDPFEPLPPEERVDCLAARLDHQLAWVMLVIYRA